MAKKKRRKKRLSARKSNRHLTLIEFRAIAFVTTLILAGLAIVLGEKEPVAWGFLGTAIGITLGYPSR